MQNTKQPFIVMLIAITVIFTAIYIQPTFSVYWVFVILLLSLILFNSVARKSLLFKGYFVSAFNPFTAKYRFKTTVELPMKSLFPKVSEIIDSSRFQLEETNERKRCFLATTPMSFTSWGENLYVELKPDGNKTEVVLCSTTVFQLSSLGRNKKNCADFLSEIERSLTI